MEGLDTRLMTESSMDLNLPQQVLKKINQFNALRGEDPNEPPKECNIQPIESQLKSRTSSTNTSPLVSDIMGKINHHAINNGDVEVHP